MILKPNSPYLEKNTVTHYAAYSQSIIYFQATVKCSKRGSSSSSSSGHIHVDGHTSVLSHPTWWFQYQPWHDILCRKMVTKLNCWRRNWKDVLYIFFHGYAICSSICYHGLDIFENILLPQNIQVILNRSDSGFFNQSKGKTTSLFNFLLHIL